MWKTGRIDVKLPDQARFDALASQRGAEPWSAGPEGMAHWLLVPPAVSADPSKLAPGLKEAPAMAAAGLGATERKPKKTGTALVARRTTATAKRTRLS